MYLYQAFYIATRYKSNSDKNKMSRLSVFLNVQTLAKHL